MRHQTVSISRRHALVAGAAAAVAVPFLNLEASAAPVVQGGGGIAGGGSVATQGGAVANFSVFGSRFERDDSTIQFFGSLILTDDTGLKLVASEISDYGTIEGEDDARQLQGFATINDEGRYPFSLKLVAAGFPGSGADSILLEVHADTEEVGATPRASDLVYSIGAALDTGDLMILTFDFGD